MNDLIYKRKSIRKYDPMPLDAVMLAAVQAQINTVTPLYPNIRYSVDIAPAAQVSARVAAPHYLIFGSEEKDGSLENSGFIGQQLSLYLLSQGFGSCWLGMAKPEEKEKSALPFVICMSFGKPAEPLFRAAADFKRKPLSAVSGGAPQGGDPRLEAARLAPSGMNAQNWYFITDKGSIRCYRKKLNPLVGLALGKISRIDMGIALCHIAEESENFRFTKDAGAPEYKGYIYVGTAKG
ncbi:MAG: nitroreductase [Oscillospiraceae bacterium]|nr:nitroreductase [Oscillospiraceae bacterium]